MKRNRQYLKSRFMSGSRPTQQDFHDLLDSFFSHLDDVFENYGLTTYNPTRIYHENETCVFNSGIYICTENNVTGPFDPDKWERLTEIPTIYTFDKWQPNQTYGLDNIVRYKGKTYFSKIDQNQGNPPTDHNYWQEITCSNQNMINWQPGIYFKNQKIIYNNKAYQVNCENYVLSKNISNEINNGTFTPILSNKHIENLQLIIEKNVLDISNNFVISLTEEIDLTKNETILLENSNSLLEVRIFDKILPSRYRIKEILTQTYDRLFGKPLQHQIVSIDQGGKLFILEGEIEFMFRFFQVKYSSENDGFYTIDEYNYDRNLDRTFVRVNEEIPSDINDGYILNYTRSVDVYNVEKLPGCVLEVDKENSIHYRQGKYLKFRESNYLILSVEEDEQTYKITINAARLNLNEPYPNLFIGKNLQISHNLNSTSFVFNFLNDQGELFYAHANELSLIIMDENTLQLDLKIPSEKFMSNVKIILIS